MTLKSDLHARRILLRPSVFSVSFFAALFLLLSISALSSDKSEKQPSLVCGVRFSDSGRHDVFVKSMVSNFFSRIAEKKGVDVEVRWHTDDESLFRDLRSGELNFFYYHKKIVPGPLESASFHPWLRYEFLGSFKDKACLYVRKNGDIKKLSRLEGKTIATQPELNEYASLRNIIGKKPQDFFSSTLLNGDAEESLALLLNGDADAAFVFKSNVSFMKISNNHSINAIRELSCSSPLEFPPVHIVDGTPAEIADSIRKMAVSAHESEDMADFRPLFKTYGFRFADAEKKDFFNIDKFLAELESKGWNADFEEWLSSVEH